MTCEGLLRDGLRAMGLAPSQAQIASLMSYLEELKKWNRAYSLTSVKAGREMVIKHLLDSALYLCALEGGALRVADVGSGAGLPGVPLKVLRPELRLFLIEPASKKAAFLRNIRRRLGLEGVEVIESRVEEVKGLEVDAVVTRALFSAAELIKNASHLIGGRGGVFVLSKGPKYAAELEGISNPFEVIEAQLPFTDITRRLIVIRATQSIGAGTPKKEARPGARGAGRGKGASAGGKQAAYGTGQAICVNRECKLRRAGCAGFAGCPGYKSKEGA